jgi:hypothetical protein
LAIVIITVTTGTVAAGATVITGIVIMNGVKTAGGGMIMAVIAAGTIAEPMSEVIVKAGAIAMTVVVIGVAGVVMVTATTDVKKSLTA